MGYNRQFTIGFLLGALIGLTIGLTVLAIAIQTRAHFSPTLSKQIEK